MSAILIKSRLFLHDIASVLAIIPLITSVNPPYFDLLNIFFL